MKKEKLLIFAYAFVTLLFLTGCKSVGLMSDKNSLLPQEIDSFGDFLGVYFILQISIIIVSVLLHFIIGKIGNIISIILHFIWIIAFRDYGFLMIVLLFGLFSIISFLANILLFGRKRNN